MPLKVRLLSLLSVFLFLWTTSLMASVQVNTTRVIYEEPVRQAIVPLKNASPQLPFLVQLWLDPVEGKKAPFVITPPYVRLGPDKAMSPRIIYDRKNGGLPEDRESVFWLNVKAIPPADDFQENQNTLQFAVNTRIKLFYRPKGLSGNPLLAPENLKWTKEGSEIRIENSSAYSVSLTAVVFKGGVVGDVPDIVPAKGSAVIPLPKGAGDMVMYRTVNDFGAVSEQFEKPVL